MLKQTVQYKDFDENEAVDTLYFNITESELTDNLHLMERFQETAKIFAGESRDLELHEVQQVLDLVKTVMRLAYGIKSADGKRFVKSDELWTEFTQTAGYDEFLMSLFKDPNKANDFLLGVFPKGLIESAQKQLSANQEEAVELRTVDTPVSDIPIPAEKDPKDMTREELLEAFKSKSQQ